MKQSVPQEKTKECEEKRPVKNPKSSQKTMNAG